MFTKMIFIIIVTLKIISGSETSSGNTFSISANYHLTPFGYFHKTCILEVPTNTLVKETTYGVLLSFENGSTSTYPACKYKNMKKYQRGNASDTPSWNGWPEHTWFGLDYAKFTNPPLKVPIQNFSATYIVPNYPKRRTGNPSAPWKNPPTLSYWLGVQGGYVLQPVIEFNGLIRNDFDFVSWNCCPSGVTVHSTPLTGIRPGSNLFGAVNRIGKSKVFEIISEFNGKSSNLRADMSSYQWTANWAEFKSESYYVTDCTQFPAGQITFKNINLITTDGQRHDPIPWKEGYETTAKGFNHPNCSGTTKNVGGNEVHIQYPDALLMSS